MLRPATDDTPRKPGADHVVIKMKVHELPESIRSDLSQQRALQKTVARMAVALLVEDGDADHRVHSRRWLMDARGADASSFGSQFPFEKVPHVSQGHRKGSVSARLSEQTKGYRMRISAGSLTARRWTAAAERVLPDIDRQMAPEPEEISKPLREPRRRKAGQPAVMLGGHLILQARQAKCEQRRLSYPPSSIEGSPLPRRRRTLLSADPIVGALARTAAP